LSSAGNFAKGETSERLPFLLVRFLWASKENEQQIIYLPICYPETILCQLSDDKAVLLNARLQEGK
jgi:hypothetical protein